MKLTVLQNGEKQFQSVLYHVACFPCRGTKFRKEFSHIGEVRSLVPSRVKLMALTATATKQTRDIVVSTLNLENPFILSVSPHKENIVFWVDQKSSSIEESFNPLVLKLKKEHLNMARVIIFCRRYEECVSLYQFFLISLGAQFIEPPGAPNISRLRLVDMFTHLTHRSVKDSIIDSFSSKDTRLRVVISTIAFGMGVNCLNVRQIVHWGSPSDTESFVQETGRAGRNGEPSCSLLLFSKKDLKPNFVSEAMIEYCSNTELCRRRLLFKDFDYVDINDTVSYCKCCDICSPSCTCIDCNNFPLCR